MSIGIDFGVMVSDWYRIGAKMGGIAHLYLTSEWPYPKAKRKKILF